jgi:predicted metal-dependent enzyme (double-stranded beta helix superfamily)
MTVAARPVVEVAGARELLEEVAALATPPVPDATARQRIGDLTAAWAGITDLTAAAQRSKDAGQSVVIAHRGDGPLLAARWFEPGAATPIHGHGSWGVAVVVEGRDRYEEWARTPDGGAQLVQVRELREGQCAHWDAPPNDVHRQEGTGGGALELVVLGRPPDDAPALRPSGVANAAARSLASFDFAALRSLYRQDVLVDCNVPRWRFQLQGRDAVIDALREEVSRHGSPRVTALRPTATERGVLLELEARFGDGPAECLWREMHLLRIDGGAIAEHTIYCTGIWDPETVARHRLQAPMVRP